MALVANSAIGFMIFSCSMPPKCRNNSTWDALHSSRSQRILVWVVSGLPNQTKSSSITLLELNERIHVGHDAKNEYASTGYLPRAG